MSFATPEAGGAKNLGAGEATVLVTAPGFDTDGQSSGARLRKAGFQLIDAGPAGNRTPEQVAELVGDAVAAIVSSDPFTPEVFAAAPRLRVIARLGVGTDAIDLEAAARAGVVVTTTPGLNDETCADHSLALLLAVLRRVVEHDSSVRRGEWNRGGSLMPWDLHAKQVAVIGYGRIGRAVVRRLEGFGARIGVFDPAAEVPSRIRFDQLSELLLWADATTVHVPLSTGTRGLIGAEEFAAMKPGAVLITTARGGVVDEVALADALSSGRLRGAGLDVFESEPPLSEWWREFPNVTLSPHIGGLSVESVEAMACRCVDQVLDVLNGQIPAGSVNFTPSS